MVRRRIGKSLAVDFEKKLFRASLVGIILGLVIWVGFLRFRIAEETRDVIVKVGKIPISYSDLALREKLLSFEYPQYKASENIRKSPALQSLIRSAQYSEILARANRPITQDVLEAEARRIDAETQDAKRLAFIKSLFGANRKNYLKIYVLPVYVERVLPFEFFPFEKELHQKEFKKAKELLQLLQKEPSQIEAVAKRENLQILKVKISRKSGLRIDLDSKKSKVIKSSKTKAGALIDLSRETLRFNLDEYAFKQNLQEANFWLDQVLQGITSGKMLNRVYERADAFWVGKLTERTDSNEALVKVINISKSDFGKWLDTEKEKISIQYSKHMRD